MLATSDCATQGLRKKGSLNPIRLFLRQISVPVFFACVMILLPLSPLLLSLSTGKGRFTRNYFRTIVKLLDTLDAMRERRSVERYVESLLFISRAPQAKRIGGFCNHCGNCCLDRRCLFLEQAGEDRYFCGIFGTMLRRFTNCGAYPINQEDIDLYACPTYYVIRPTFIARRPAVLWLGSDPDAGSQSAITEEGRAPENSGVRHGNPSAATLRREMVHDRSTMRPRD